MNPIQSTLLATILLLAYGAVDLAQTPKFRPHVDLPATATEISPPPPQNRWDDGCPPAEMISDSYSTFKAKVLDVINGNTLTVRSRDSKRKVIHMVGIAVPAIKTTLGIASREHLSLLVREKNIEVWLINSTDSNRATFREATGIVRIPAVEFLDINLEQIKSGMAQYHDFGPYTQDARDRCLYEKAETEAKASRLGIWALSRGYNKALQLTAR